MQLHVHVQIGFCSGFRHRGESTTIYLEATWNENVIESKVCSGLVSPVCLLTYCISDS